MTHRPLEFTALDDPRDEQIAALANLVGRLAFLVGNEIGPVHSREIQREADAIRDALIEARNRQEARS